MALKKPARNTLRICAAAALLMAVQAASAEEAAIVSVGTGVNYTTGNYGTTTSTDITSIPFIASYEKGPWSFKATIPYLRITGATDVVAGLGRVKKGAAAGTTTTSAVRTESGLGDIVTAATYNFYNDAKTQFGADLTGKIKWGTADSDKGLGTGKNDYALQLDVYKRLDPHWTLFGAAGYSILGSSDAIPLKNVFNAGFGTTYKITDRDSAGVAYDYRQRSSDAGFAQSELTAFVVHKFDKSWKAQAYLLKGFTDGSPDWGGGASVGYAF